MFAFGNFLGGQLPAIVKVMLPKVHLFRAVRGQDDELPRFRLHYLGLERNVPEDMWGMLELLQSNVIRSFNLVINYNTQHCSKISFIFSMNKNKHDRLVQLFA